MPLQSLRPQPRSGRASVLEHRLCSRMEIAAVTLRRSLLALKRKRRKEVQCKRPPPPNFRANDAHCSDFFRIISSLFSTSADGRYRRDPRDFSRNGPLQPELLTTLLLYMVADGNRRGYRHLLDGFWDEARSYGLELPTDTPVSAVAREVAPTAA